MTDDNCPFNGSQTFSYSIYVVGVAAIVDSIIDPTCFNSCDGRAMVRVVNGIPPFSYLWNDSAAQTTAKAIGLCAGTYTVQGTDSTGCTTSTMITLEQPKEIELEMDSIGVSCNGGSDGMAIVSNINFGNPPFTYQWEVAAGLQTTDTAVNLMAGIYAVTVTDSTGCEAIDSIEVPEPLPLQVTAIAVSNVSCFGLNDGVATVNITGGTAPYSIQWDSLSNFQTSDTAINLLAGTHLVTVTDANGCTDTSSVFLTQPNEVITLTLTTTDINCTGDSSGSATVTATGGTPPYTYTWSANTGGQTTPTVTNLAAGVYSVIVTDINDCSALPNIVISEPDSVLVITPIDSSVACRGYTNGIAGVNVSGGSPPYSIQWDAAAGSQTTLFASNLGAGTYNVIVTDSLGCTDSTNVQVLEADSALLVTGGKIDVTCHNGSDGVAYLDISGGLMPYTIQWDTTSGSQTSDSALNLKAGTYTVQVTDGYGCVFDTTFIVNEPPPLLTLTANSTDVACAGDSTGTASIQVAGGTPPYSYLWSPNTGGQNTDTAFNLPAGTYYVTVFDSNDCVISPNILINEPDTALSADLFIQNAVCFNDSSGYAVVQGLGGSPPYTYQWDSLANNQTTDTAFNLSAQNYTVRITDSLNCTFDTTVAVSQPNSPLQVALTVSDVNCFGGIDGEAYAQVSGGSAPYSIQWGASTGSQTGDTATGLTSGYHVITIVDSNMCEIVDSVFVDGPAEPIVSLNSSIDASCYEESDGMAIAEASGGSTPYQYFWDSNAGNQANDTAFNLRAGTYTVTIVDANQCDTTFSVTVNEPSQLFDSVFVSSDYAGSEIRCFGDSSGEATALGIGGTAPYTYQWDSSANFQTTSIATNLEEGVYSVVITDTNGCQTTGFVSIASPQKMGFTVADFKNISCFNGSDGRIEVAGFGGTAPYTYSWNPTSQTGNVLDSVPIGTYTVTITDTNNCTYDTSFTLTQADYLEIDSVVGIDAACYNQASGSATVYGSGGTPPYSYQWLISQGIYQLTQTAVNLSAGSYPVTLIDDNNCMAVDTVVIGEPSQIIVTASANDTICAAQNTIISASATGGDSASYQYVWLPVRPDSNATQVVAPTVTTNYAVRAMDASGCLSTPDLVTVFVRNMDNDTIRVSALGDVCEGDSTTVTGFHNGPFGNYTYTWNFGPQGFGPHFVSPDTAQYYIMTVSDICGNQLSDSVLISVFPNPELSLDSILAEGCDPLTVDFDENSNTGNGFTYEWEFGDGNGSRRKDPTYTYRDPGTYNVVLAITSDQGCTTLNDNSPSLVIVHPTPNASFSADPLTADMRNPTIDFTNNTTGSTGQNWTFGDGGTSVIFDPSHTYADTGRYRVILISTSSEGCQDTASLDVIIDPYYFISVPNAFTPGTNSNGGNWRNDPESNRVFYPYTTTPEAVSEFEMLIFNRWGELIFESENIYEGWDGFYRQKQSPQEVYVYKIKLRFDNGQVFEEVGDLTLFR